MKQPVSLVAVVISLAMEGGTFMLVVIEHCCYNMVNCFKPGSPVNDLLFTMYSILYYCLNQRKRLVLVLDQALFLLCSGLL